MAPFSAAFRESPMSLLCRVRMRDAATTPAPRAAMGRFENSSCSGGTTIITAPRLLSAVATARNSQEAFGDPAAERLQVVREHANALGQLLGRHRVFIHDPPKGYF